MAATGLIEKESPVFWQRLQERIKITVYGLDVLRLKGSISSIGQNQFRVEMSRPGTFANMTYTDLFKEADVIRCNTPDADSYELRFCVISDCEIGVVDPRGSGVPMDPDEASEFVMRRMADLIERRSWLADNPD